MKKKRILSIGLLAAAAAIWSGIPTPASALTRAEVDALVRQTGVPDYNSTPNWANSPILRKFVDDLPTLCTDDADPKNNLGQCLPVAIPDTGIYSNEDYYEIELVEFREQMHSDLPPVAGGSGGTLLRGYRQVNAPAGSAALTPHNLGPVIVAQKDRPVRIKFINNLPTGEAGKLFIPVDTTVMGSGPGPNHDRTNDARTDAEVCQDSPNLCFSQNRGDLHLHGGRTPWISDGTAHQWITPAGEATAYPKGASVAYVPDMWFDKFTHAHITACAGKTTCSEPGTTPDNNPGPGAQTYYYTNGQSARMMFYHDHSWGITRLNVYAGGVAGYLVADPTEAKLVTDGLLPGATNTIPLIIQDKTFVDAATILDTDPTWIWGSQPGTGNYGVDWSTGATPVTGDLWWPHVYVPAQNPYNPDFTGVNPFGRWHYGPWFWPPTDVAEGPIPNPYYDPASPDPDIANQPPEIASTPNPSWGAEAFMDTPVVNGTAYPKLEVGRKNIGSAF